MTDEEQMALFLAAVTSLSRDDTSKKGLIENAEPMTATCEVERS